MKRRPLLHALSYLLAAPTYVNADSTCPAPPPHPAAPKDSNLTKPDCDLKTYKAQYINTGVELTIGIFGQSHAPALWNPTYVSTGESYGGFQALTAELYAHGIETLRILYCTSDGSAALKSRDISSGKDNHWIDDSTTSLRPGSLLSTAIETLWKNKEHPPDIILWLQGEGDSSGLKGDAARFEAEYFNALLKIAFSLKDECFKLRGICSFGDQSDQIPFLLQPIGRRYGVDSQNMGVTLIRLAQCRARQPTISSIRFLADLWDLPLWGDRSDFTSVETGSSNIHLSPEGAAIFGRRAAHGILQNLDEVRKLGRNSVLTCGTAIGPPRVTKISRPENGRLRLVVEADLPLLVPLPDIESGYFGVINLKAPKKIDVSCELSKDIYSSQRHILIDILERDRGDLDDGFLIFPFGNLTDTDGLKYQCDKSTPFAYRPGIIRDREGTPLRTFAVDLKTLEFDEGIRQ